MKRSLVSFALLGVLLLAGCAGKETLTLRQETFADLDGWNQTQHHGAVLAFRESCKSILKRGENASLGLRMGKKSDWEPACIAVALESETADPKGFFERYFVPLKSISSRRPDGLFTGYYEIELNGSLKKTSRYRYPLYRKPPEHLRTLTREEIDEGGLSGHGLELLWVDDAVRRFFLHVQGSGVVKLPDGRKLRVGYDGQNGQKYVSLGRWLIDHDYMEEEEVNGPAIKAWLYQNPALATEAMQQNPSYIYFRLRPELARHEGPIGAQEVPLTPFHSLAVDKSFYGYGMPVWVETTLPAYEAKSERPFRQLLVAQDTGGAIRGAIRGDVFFGRGNTAEKLAGYMKQRGNMWVLLPHTLAESVRDE